MSRVLIVTLVIIVLVLGSISAAYLLLTQEKEVTASSVTKPMKSAPLKPQPRKPKHTITPPKTSKTLSVETRKSTWTWNQLVRRPLGMLRP